MYCFCFLLLLLLKCVEGKAVCLSITASIGGFVLIGLGTWGVVDIQGNSTKWIKPTCDNISPTSMCCKSTLNNNTLLPTNCSLQNQVDGICEDGQALWCPGVTGSNFPQAASMQKTKRGMIAWGLTITSIVVGSLVALISTLNLWSDLIVQDPPCM
jgi:hypothetical protein